MGRLQVFPSCLHLTDKGDISFWLLFGTDRRMQPQQLHARCFSLVCPETSYFSPVLEMIPACQNYQFAFSSSFGRRKRFCLFCKGAAELERCFFWRSSLILLSYLLYPGKECKGFPRCSCIFLTKSAQGSNWEKNTFSISDIPTLHPWTVIIECVFPGQNNLI